MESDSVCQTLRKYVTCDISDALLKLEVPHGGFLPGLTMWSPMQQAGDTIIAGPAYTVKFVRKTYTSAPTPPHHYIDSIPSGAVVFISAPHGTFNAVYGGLMSVRAKYSGAAGTVVDGCIRDLQEHRNLEYPVFAKSVSTPAFYEVARPSEINVPVSLQHQGLEVVINPGDYIVADLNGVVCVPKDLANRVVEIIPGQTQADDNMASAIAKGMGFAEASKQFRKK